jgi:hypothetical protein
MIITNLTNTDYWFGPMHLPAGSGTSTLNLDDTSDTSLYLLNDEVADAVNTLLLSSGIAVTSAAATFPRATGTPALLHGDGSPEGMVFGPQGSLYMRRDSSLATTGLYTKTTGVTQNTGWVSVISYVQLGAGNPEATLAFGGAEINFGGTDSGTVTVTHNMGRTPGVALAGSMQAPADVISFNCDTFTETTFLITGQAVAPPGGPFLLGWIALG